MVQLKNRLFKQFHGFKTLNCHSCGHYLNGKGDKECLTCKEITRVLPRNNQSPSSIPYPETAIENMAGRLDTIDVLDALRKIDPKEATSFCQHFIMQMTVDEIAESSGISDRHVRRLIQQAIKNVRKLLIAARVNGQTMSITIIERDI
jgi:predicted DNA-binding protein (UPF0251 family)